MTLAACATGDKDGDGGELGKIEKNAEKETKKLEKEATPYLTACKSEIEKVCKVDKKEIKALFECLKKNKDKLGPDCKTATEKLAKEKNSPAK